MNKKIILFIISPILFIHILNAQCFLNETPSWGTPLSTTGSPKLDQILVNEAVLMQSEFGVKAYLSAYNDQDGPNAFAIDGNAYFIIMGKTLMLDEYVNINNANSIIAIMAHEFGHLLQYKNNLKANDGWFGKWPELQADFMSGWYMGKKKYLPNSEFEKVINSFWVKGDDNYFSPSHHGTREERAIAFKNGYLNANLSLTEAYNYGINFIEKISKELTKFDETTALKDEEKRIKEMFLLRKYSEIIPRILALQAKGVTYPVLNRLLGYSYYEATETFDKDCYKKGVNAMEKFFSQYPVNYKFLPTDYEYYGLNISKAFKDSIPQLYIAIDQLKKAIAIDDNEYAKLYGDIGNIYIKMKKYPEAIDAYNKKIKEVKNVDANDYYHLSRAYFYNKQFEQSDAAALQIIKLNPDMPSGYLWRAKSNAMMDPKTETFLAKPYYEAYLGKIKTEEYKIPANQNYVTEACDYLTYYWLVKNDKVKAKEYFNIIQVVNPSFSKLPAYKKVFDGK